MFVSFYQRRKTKVWSLSFGKIISFLISVGKVFGLSFHGQNHCLSCFQVNCLGRPPLTLNLSKVNADNVDFKKELYKCERYKIHAGVHGVIFG